MCSAVPRPPAQVGGNVRESRRVVICHAFELTENDCQNVKFETINSDCSPRALATGDLNPETTASTVTPSGDVYARFVIFRGFEPRRGSRDCAPTQLTRLTWVDTEPDHCGISTKYQSPIRRAIRGLW